MTGSKEDLVKYRLEKAKETLQGASIPGFSLIIFPKVLPSPPIFP